MWVDGQRLTSGRYDTGINTHRLQNNELISNHNQHETTINKQHKLTKEQSHEGPSCAHASRPPHTVMVESFAIQRARVASIPHFPSQIAVSGGRFCSPVGGRRSLNG